MTSQSESFQRLLNVGCGRCYHQDWTNIDLVAHGPGVRQYDLRRGLPYEHGSFDAVYHSHVLEHLTPDDARTMLSECRRVIRPGGVIRLAVPDLEGIARGYLESLDAAESGRALAVANHRWMTLELIDQLVRQRGGGQMGQAMWNSDLVNLEFVRSRIGGEMGEHKNGKTKKTVGQRLSKVFAGVRKQLALAAVTIIDGSTGRAAYREGRFRQSGEIHRWMYDHVSLADLLHEVGFKRAAVQSAESSRITDFDSYQLDRDDVGQVRKPDSLFMEAVNPLTIAQAASLEASKRVA
ncbi:MAG: class I SAM-dependent methyltransferase [Rubripirellula sp.]